MPNSNRVRAHGMDIGWVRTRVASGAASLLHVPWLGPAFMVAGSVLLIYTLAIFTDACVYDSHQKAILDLADRTHHGPVVNPAVGSGTGTLIGRVDIPRVGVSAVVVDGVDDAALRRAVGLVPGSAWPGKGSSVLAGHRDQLFRGLKKIRAGDEVTVTMPGERVRYEIVETKIVDRDRAAVAIAEMQSDLTLYTCYPFSYIGSAPQRFLAAARRLPAMEKN